MNVFEFWVLLVPENSFITIIFRPLIGHHVAEVNVVGFHSLELVHSAEIRDVLHIPKQEGSLTWLKMEAGVHEITPHRHPLSEVVYGIFLRLLKAESGILSVLVYLKVVLEAISVSAFTVRPLFLQHVEVDIFSLLDGLEVLLLDGRETVLMSRGPGPAGTRQGTSR